MKNFLLKNRIRAVVILFLCAGLCLVGAEPNVFALSVDSETGVSSSPPKNLIKWVDFNIPLPALKQAYQYDVTAHEKGKNLNWIELLALTGAKYGGGWEAYKPQDMDKIAQTMLEGRYDELEQTMNSKSYRTLSEVYDAILHEYVGPYAIEAPDPEGSGRTVTVEQYGLKCFSPIAKGYSFSHSDDFGVPRSFGYSRPHLGNDLMSSIGTPVVAVESGVVEEAGWNRYGGWRIGIRSFDRKRYYYYAHLRKNHPFAAGLKRGDTVTAGDIIGYVGMTGYSTTENVNGMTVPHLHFGLQIIFDESQKDGSGEIWIDVYNLVNFLEQNTSAAVKDPSGKDFVRKYKMTA